MKLSFPILLTVCLSTSCSGAEDAEVNALRERVAALESQVSHQSFATLSGPIAHSHPLLIKGNFGGCYFPEILAGSAPFGQRGLLLDDVAARISPGARERSCQLVRIQVMKRDGQGPCIVDFDVLVNFHPIVRDQTFRLEAIEPQHLEIRGSPTDENGNVTIRFPLFPCEFGPASVASIDITAPGA